VKRRVRRAPVNAASAEAVPVPIGSSPDGPPGPAHVRTVEAVIESGSSTSEQRGRGGSAPALADWIATWQPEDPAVQSARQRAAEVGVSAVDVPTGGVLRLLAAATGAKAVVELGTGAGVSSLCLLRGMRSDGILTSVDAEPEHQRMAKASLQEAAIPSGRARLIGGRALDVLPRLSDGAYDLVFCDANRSENLDYLDAALRLLRTGGTVVFAGALAGGKVAESSARDQDVLALRELAKVVRDEPRLASAAIPVGQGLLAACVVG
jgi:predicted O-methyltransferase YrrM